MEVKIRDKHTKKKMTVEEYCKKHMDSTIKPENICGIVTIHMLVNMDVIMMQDGEYYWLDSINFEYVPDISKLKYK